ncbi:MAG: hypothetical protein ABIL01_34095 [Pseudomonadota bacterium]
MKRLVLFALVFTVSWPVLAADTITTGTLRLRTTVTVFPGLAVETFSFLSNASGVITATLENIRGTIRRVSIKPDDDPLEPTDLFDMTLTDDMDVDVLTDSGANLTSGTTTTFAPKIADGHTSVSMTTFGDLDLAVSNAGASKGMILRLYLDPEFR